MKNDGPRRSGAKPTPVALHATSPKASAVGAPASKPSHEPKGRFLDSLSARARKRLVEKATFVQLPLKLSLFRREETAKYAYLLTKGMTSEVFESKSGECIELSTIGDEGVVGWVRLLGPLAGLSGCNMQIGGEGYRIPLVDLQREFDSSPEVRQRLLEFAQHQAIISYQLCACNRLHQAGPRFARWMLMTQDRTHMDELHLTQEFMADMLGTRRTTVAEAASALQKAGAIQYKRGTVRIVNRLLLEHHACECYALLKKRFNALYTGTGTK